MSTLCIHGIVLSNMKVHLITSRSTLEKDIATLRRLISIVRESGHELALEWVERAYKRSTDSSQAGADWGTIFKQNLETIARADVVVAETSYDSFGVGYQVAFAVEQKKPVLLLRHDTSDPDTFVSGVEDGWVAHRHYNDSTIEGILKDFFNDHDIRSKDLRFNFFIDRKIYNYLRWASFKTGKTKSEILRNLVENEIDKKRLDS